MAVSSCQKLFFSFECRSDPDFSAPPPSFNRRPVLTARLNSARSAAFYGPSTLILRFPPNFHRQLSTKARRNCSNIGVAQIVAASWSNTSAASSTGGAPAASAVDAAATAAAISAADEDVSAYAAGAAGNGAVPVQLEGSVDSSYSSFLKTDGSKAIHAGT